MKTLKLKDGLYWTGIPDKDLRVFDIIMYTEFGTTYNSYFIDGGEKRALCESAKLKFWDEYKDKLDSLLDVRALDYLIVNHTEPDHAGSIEKLLEINPLLTIVATATAIGFLKEIVNRDFASIAVKDGDTLSLGSKTLTFKVFPNLHWPDTMYTYIAEDKALITCDSFGSHYAHDGVLRSTVTDEEGYWRATRYYFDNILGPFRQKYMNAALDWVEQADIELICPGHGPVHDTGIPKLLETYRAWCTVPERANPKLVIPYVSAYGYTALLAEKIAEGVACAAPKAEIRLYDMVTADAAAVAADLADADGILLGSPTILQEALPPIYSLTLGMFPPVYRGRLASAFGSYGWSGEAVPHLIARLEQIGCKTLPGLRVRLKPSENNLMDAFDFGYNFGCELTKKKPELKAVSATAAKTLVKCLICGEVFDASIDICPVCGAGSDKFVPVASTETTFKKNTGEKFVILGGGPAARYAAEAIRVRNESAGILMISAENELPYNRPMLTKMLLGDMSGNKLAIDRFDWYKDHNVTLRLGTTVTGINTEDKIVRTDKGDYEYDKLIYALGANCFVVPIKGADQPHVVTIRSIADCDKVKALVKAGRKVVTIGGGVMGLEGAWELKKGGCDVTILETAPGLLPRQLDDPAGAMLETIVTDAGINVVTGAKIVEITGDAVVLDDGRSFPADFVVMSTGMRGNTAVGREAGLAVDKLIVCDEQMRTSVADIYGCGDCAEVDGEPQGFWAQAVETGRIAGANAAGEGLTYDRIPASLSIVAFGSSIFSMGTNGKDGRDYQVIESRDLQRKTYKKLFFFHGRLDGVILVGDTSDMVNLSQALARKAAYKEFI